MNMNSPTHLPSLAVFDFDGTLIRGDSMWQFLALVAGWPRVLWAFFRVVISYIEHSFVDKEDRATFDRRTFFKQQLLLRLIAGHSIESFKQPIARLLKWVRWIEPMRETLQEHYDQGHHVVIASGALDLYLHELIKDIPHHAVLCTNITVIDGKATASMYGGNCVREGKAERLAAYIEAHGPYGESWGYGNFPDDVPMMNLLKYRIVV